MDSKAVATGERTRFDPRRTVVFVDEEPLIRKLADAVLAGPDLRVWIADNISNACEKFAEHGEMIDLIVLDLIAPRLREEEWKRHLQELAPRARILFTTDRPGAILPVGLASTGVLLKPYGASELARAVRSAVDGISF